MAEKNEQLKKDLKNILKIKGNVTRSRPVKGQIKNEHFCTCSLKLDYGIHL